MQLTENNQTNFQIAKGTRLTEPSKQIIFYYNSIRVKVKQAEMVLK